jgi:hypothetical protein
MSLALTTGSTSAHFHTEIFFLEIFMELTWPVCVHPVGGCWALNSDVFFFFTGLLIGVFFAGVLVFRGLLCHILCFECIDGVKENEMRTRTIEIG